MKRLGVIKNVMRDGSILMKATMSVKPGTVVYDARGKALGNVTRMFGPVDGPYLVLKVRSGVPDTLKLLESTVYFDPNGSGGARKRRG